MNKKQILVKEIESGLDSVFISAKKLYEEYKKEGEVPFFFHRFCSILDGLRMGLTDYSILSFTIEFNFKKIKEWKEG